MTDCFSASSTRHGRPELLDVVPRRFTWTQLCAPRDAIVSEYRGKITERGTRITTIGPAMLENKVRVTLNNTDEQFAAALTTQDGSDRVIVDYNLTITCPESDARPPVTDPRS